MGIDRSCDLQARRGAMSLSTMFAVGLAAGLVGAATPALSESSDCLSLDSARSETPGASHLSAEGLAAHAGAER